MKRYGVEWFGPTAPIVVEMPDGYWTPWHIAQAEVNGLRKSLHDILMVCEENPVDLYQRMETIAHNALAAFPARSEA